MEDMSLCDLSLNTSGPSTCYSNRSEAVDIDSIFKSIVNSKTVSITATTAHKIFYKLCNIPLVQDVKLKGVIPYMLVHHIKIWPGWQKSSKYETGQMSYERWLDAFKKYLTHKLTYLAKIDYKTALSQFNSEYSYNEENKKKVDASVQTDPTEKEFAPYYLEIRAPVADSTKFFFKENPQGKISVKTYKSSQNPKPITIEMLMNWPQVKIKFKGDEIVLVRENQHEITRYMCKSNTKVKIDPVEFIQEVDAIDSKKTRLSYSVNLMKVYLQHFLLGLEKNLESFPDGTVKNLKMDTLYSTKIFFEQFLLDIEDFNLNKSIGNNSYVVFNIGKNAFYRIRKCTNNPVGYYETIVPKMCTSLVNFYGVQQNQDGTVSFRTTDPKQFSAPSIEYTCIYCHSRFLSAKRMISHLDEVHSSEGSVNCIKCNASIDFYELANSRFQHIC